MGILSVQVIVLAETYIITLTIALASFSYGSLALSILMVVKAGELTTRTVHYNPSSLKTSHTECFS